MSVISVMTLDMAFLPMQVGQPLSHGCDTNISKELHSDSETSVEASNQQDVGHSVVATGRGVLRLSFSI